MLPGGRNQQPLLSCPFYLPRISEQKPLLTCPRFEVRKRFFEIFTMIWIGFN